MSTDYPISAGQYSDKGVKENNEDACGIRLPQGAVLASKGFAAVIADGVSGSEAGREAAEACVQGFLNDYYSTPDSWTVKTAGRRVLGALNRWLFGLAQRSYSHDRALISTLSVLVIKSATAHLFHVGDTRIYRYRDGQLECLTQDHCVVHSGEKSFLARAMGADISVEIDYRTETVKEGDTFVLTTDGVHEYTRVSTIGELLGRYRSQPERAARAISERALHNGSHDNVTCQVVRIDRLPRQNEEEFFRELTQLPFPPPLEPGMVLDGYRILRELHASKRTQVYVALDTDTDRKVILKTPSVNYEDDPEYIDRFLHEEWVGRRINNNHVLRVLEQKRRRQCLYYVTEHVEGQTLRQWMNDNPRPSLTEVRNIVDQLAKGLRAFHRLEMVHQDVKPENVMIDAHGTIKVIDFGSAKIAGIDEIQNPTVSDVAMATINYAPPEYFLGHPGSNRSDGYAVGVIAYELLTGKLPYGGPLSPRTIKRVRYTSARQYDPYIPVWVDRALQKAVELNSRHRYETSSEFIYDLSHPNEKFLKSEPLPLIEREPVRFWQGISVILLLSNLVLLYVLNH